MARVKPLWLGVGARKGVDGQVVGRRARQTTNPKAGFPFDSGLIVKGEEKKTTAAPIVGTLPTTLEPEAAVEAQNRRNR